MEKGSGRLFNRVHGAHAHFKRALRRVTCSTIQAAVVLLPRWAKLFSFCSYRLLCFPQTRHFLKCVPRSSDCRSGRCEGRIAGLWGWTVGLSGIFMRFDFCTSVGSIGSKRTLLIQFITQDPKRLTAKMWPHHFSIVSACSEGSMSAVPSQDWWTDGWTDLSTDQWRFYGWMKQKGRGGLSDGQRDVGSTSALFKLLSASKR